MDLKTIGKWVYLAGLLVAILAALFSFSADWLSIVLALAGIFVGIFFTDTDDLTNFAIRYLALGAVYASLDAFPAIGEFITSIFGAAFMFLGPVLLTTLFMWFINKTFKKEM
jgi:uncharacterized membrane protein